MPSSHVVAGLGRCRLRRPTGGGQRRTAAGGDAGRAAGDPGSGRQPAGDGPLVPWTRLHTLPAVRSGTYPDPIGPSTRRRRMSELGANALGEVLVPGRVPDCYLGLRLDPAGDAHAAGVLVVAPAALLHPAVPQPDGTLLYELVTGHPGRAPRERCSSPTSPWSCAPG